MHTHMPPTPTIVSSFHFLFYLRVLIPLARMYSVDYLLFIPFLVDDLFKIVIDSNSNNNKQ